MYAGAMPAITPTAWLNRTADEAADFYVHAFGLVGVDAEIAKTFTYPDPNDHYLAEFAGKTRVKLVRIEDFTLGLINASDEHTTTPAFNLYVSLDKTKAQRLWDILSENGVILVEFSEYTPEIDHGWLTDKFGISWQITTHPDLPTIAPAIHFNGQARQAGDYYLEIFGGTRNEILVEGDELILSSIIIDGQTLVLMDSAVDAIHSAGMSLHLRARGEQQETFHRALSYNPEKDMYGWMEDKFGITWQISDEG
ncbi:3-demethylubiquinone-9 3-methyltransferase [Corynebacterium kutscheri]|nr:3-demethylubiquinone-9 3-methyltransferase [Corynebacterium kutscheri]